MSRSLIKVWLPALTFMVAAVPTIAVTVSPSAAADCVSSNGTVLCSQGDTRGSNTGQGPGSGMSYPCDFDWYCDYDGFDYGIVLDPDFDGGISGPSRPNNDLPGRGGGGRGGRR
ncbi:hypothetical protein [[Mycobacterium] burgundiense]|uniref:Uncharacterized protein n=1 Tax=[Mycobacterium] burgundiense TaxID=3064286 RepID=A0ABN9NNA6_9MYCO|nr:hypothetical protein [Mycolicibacterium sp. MU0053]CAJ1507726.1 hypothetical protein MU0053_003608 [Mycolicibacterium sp. MU0053]